LIALPELGGSPGGLALGDPKGTMRIDGLKLDPPRTAVGVI